MPPPITTTSGSNTCISITINELIPSKDVSTALIAILSFAFALSIIVFASMLSSHFTFPSNFL